MNLYSCWFEKLFQDWKNSGNKYFDDRKTFIVAPMNGIPPTIPTATTSIEICHCDWWLSSVKFRYKPGYKPSGLL